MNLCILKPIVLSLAWYGQSSASITQAAQRKEKPTEESPRYKESESWRWEKGRI